MKSLDEIACAIGADKSTRTSLPKGDSGATPPSQGHGYTIFYEHYFSKLREQPINMLEIGVLDGRSLRMWNEYFPKAAIYALDIVPEYKEFENERTKVFIGSQSDPAMFAEIKQTVPEGFDIIIDDGSHYVKHVIASFGGLYDALRPGGFYVVEDIHCAGVRDYGKVALSEGMGLELLSDGNDPDEMVQFLKATRDRPDVSDLAVHLKKICFIRKTDPANPEDGVIQRGDRIDELYAEPQRQAWHHNFWSRVGRRIFK